MKFEYWSKNFIIITTSNRKRSTKNEKTINCENRDRDKFDFIVSNELIIENKQLQNIEIQKSKN